VSRQPETEHALGPLFGESKRLVDLKQADVLVLDSGGFGKLSARTRAALALIEELRRADLWPALVPTIVLVEALHGHPGKDANANRFLKTVLKESDVSTETARRAAELRRRARQGSAVDALVVAVAEPNGTVLTGDEADITALATHAQGVSVELV
jgi:predicted nucleic acid-binding protein